MVEPQPPSPRAHSVRRLVLAARILLLALAGGVAVAGFVLARRDPGAASQRRYACPMHPEVTANGPGDCPICGMALVPAGGGDALRTEVMAPRQTGAVEVARPRVFSQEVRAPASAGSDGSVRALLHADAITALESGERALFIPARAAGPAAPVRLVDPSARAEDASTAWVRFRPEGAPIPAGTTGWVQLAAKQRAALMVPSSAVLHSPSGAFLFASDDGRTFKRRPVVVGRTLFGLTAIVSGLREGERVATRSAFFLDAEERLASPGEPGQR